MDRLHFISILISSCLISSCHPDSNEQSPLFKLLQADYTGLDSKNEIMMTEDFNVFNYMNIFNGGGVAIGDFNNDGLSDIFLTRNQNYNRLYLNEGDLKFKDVTTLSGLQGQEGFSTGCSAIDINNDGMLDIYVGQLGGIAQLNGTSQLYVCRKIENGIPIFEDQARDMNIAFSGLAQQASFFDYDRDGDLDMYQLNQSVHQSGISRGRRKVALKNQRSGDRLLRNDSQGTSVKFTDVTLQAGIQSTALGFGLGIATSDINNDGWVDIYITNDFHENDYLYINQKDGTFKESVPDQMMHTSRFSMGVDIADINNDGWNDIISLDMMPEDPTILKTSIGEDVFDVFQLKIDHGFHHQYSRNALQLNNKNGSFSDIGMFSSVHASDWSWSAILVDFDHDGLRDLFISNGIPRRMNNVDYVNFKLYGQTPKDNVNLNSELDIIEHIPQIKLTNKFYRNSKDLRFGDINNLIEGDKESYSNGAAYGDLDNDGDLDIVTNNIDDYPFIYENLTAQIESANSDYLHIVFEGPANNINAIGARLIIEEKERTRSVEHYPVKGYMSSHEFGIHMAIPDTTAIIKTRLIWPDGSVLENPKIEFNKKTTLTYQPGLNMYQLQNEENEKQTLVDKTILTSLNYKHEENEFNEFTQEALIPHMMSREGPAIAIGDLDGDGLDDVYLGGAMKQAGEVFIQESNSTFKILESKILNDDQLFEDVEACIIDFDNDGDNDIIVASGGNQTVGNLQTPRQRAYINDGTGHFIREYLFKEAVTNIGGLAYADYDQDGDIDLFFGSRVVQNQYGLTPRSYLYNNNGDGTFTLNNENAELNNAGLVKDVKWGDIDNDGDLDIILALEWDAITIYLNEKNLFTKHPINDLKGWWNTVLLYDIDNDSDLDIIAGNLGLNSKLKATKEEPIRQYIEDFDYNGTLDQVLTYYLDGKEILFHTHDELMQQLPALKKKFLYAADLANATVPEIFGSQRLKNTTTLTANYMASAWFENTSDLDFNTHQLPERLQYSTLEALHITDLNDDQKYDILTGGNFYHCNIEMGRYDADYGNILHINNDKTMEVIPLIDTPIMGAVRHIRSINNGNTKTYIYAINNEHLKVLSSN